MTTGKIKRIGNAGAYLVGLFHGVLRVALVASCERDTIELSVPMGQSLG